MDRAYFSLPLLILLCTCDRAPQLEAEDGYYRVLDDESRLVYKDGDTLRGCTFFGVPYWSMPLYPGDSTLEVSDSTYVTYTMGTDSIPQTHFFFDDTLREVRQLAKIEDAPYRPPGSDVLGRTYAIDTPEGEISLYFPGDGSEPLATTNADDLDIRRNESIAPADGSGSLPHVSYARTLGDNRVRIYRLILAEREGAPVGYRLERTSGSKPSRVDGPFPARRLISPVPDAVPHHNIVRRLRQGRMEVKTLRRTHPDSIFNRDRDLSIVRQLPVADLPRLGFEFREDGYYSVFTNDEIYAEGSWRLSDDRNFLLLKGGGFMPHPPLPIIIYDEDRIAFRFSLGTAKTIPVTTRSDLEVHELEISFFDP